MDIGAVKFKNIENIYKSNKVQAKNVTPSKKVDTVEISELGKYLNKVNTNKEEINIDKVNEIKKQIDNGTYKIDSRELAKKIIGSKRGVE